MNIEDIAFNTGYPEIDTDHENIISAFKTISHLETYQDTISRINAVEQFLDYATNHLDREEKLMRQIGYPGYNKHIEAHRILQEAFLAVVKEALKGKAPHDEVLRSFTSIFLGHSASDDVALATWIEAQPRPSSRKRHVHSTQGNHRGPK